MTLPKFIITMDGYLTSSKSLTLGHSSKLDGSRSIATFRLGMVNQHKDLLKPGDQCIGGGYYHFNYTTNRILLDRESYDFGRPKWHLLDFPLFSCFEHVKSAEIPNYCDVKCLADGISSLMVLQ